MSTNTPIPTVATPVDAGAELASRRLHLPFPMVLRATLHRLGDAHRVGLATMFLGPDNVTTRLPMAPRRLRDREITRSRMAQPSRPATRLRTQRIAADRRP